MLKLFKTLCVIIMFLITPTICFAEAGDHDKAERRKELYNKVYPKTKTVGRFTTLKRYKNSKVYYNVDKYPTGAPKYVQDIGNYKLYRREIRKQRNNCRRNYYK